MSSPERSHLVLMETSRFIAGKEAGTDMSFRQWVGEGGTSGQWGTRTRVTIGDATVIVSRHKCRMRDFFFFFLPRNFLINRMANAHVQHQSQRLGAHIWRQIFPFLRGGKSGFYSNRSKTLTIISKDFGKFRIVQRHWFKVPHTGKGLLLYIKSRTRFILNHLKRKLSSMFVLLDP